MVSELFDVRIIYLLKAVTPAWVTNTVPFTIAINHIRYSSPFQILQAEDKCQLSVGPARLLPRASNKHYSARGGPINLSFMYIT